MSAGGNENWLIWLELLMKVDDLRSYSISYYFCYAELLYARACWFHKNMFCESFGLAEDYLVLYISLFYRGYIAYSSRKVFSLSFSISSSSISLLPLPFFIRKKSLLKFDTLY